MTVQNVAIVFGPTLLKPEVETANITTYMVFQNQIVEFILNEFESIFHMWLTWTCTDDGVKLVPDLWRNILKQVMNRDATEI